MYLDHIRRSSLVWVFVSDNIYPLAYLCIKFDLAQSAMEVYSYKDSYIKYTDRKA